MGILGSFSVPNTEGFENLTSTPLPLHGRELLPRNWINFYVVCYLPIYHYGILFDKDYSYRL